ncbi:MAG: hypothetical protein HQK87_07155, partial [Nitrospinae bacterium]|nr:hypothetical protein [Nitrospinota bacterium]
FMEGLHHSSLPVFVVFFSLSGHKVDLSVMAELWPLALLAVALRVAAIRKGTLWGRRWGGEDERIARHAWAGFVGQAGLSLGFAVMIATDFPPWGQKIATLIVATIVINEFLGPILMKRSLTLAGEAGADEPPSRGERAGGQR